MPLPERSGIPPEQPQPRHRWGCAIGCGTLLIASVVGGGMLFANKLNEGTETSSDPAATASPFEYGASATPSPEETLADDSSPVDPTETASATPEETQAPIEEPAPEETPVETTEAPANGKDDQSAQKPGSNNYKECPWTEANPQTIDSNGQVEVWSSCGAPGLAAYEYPSVTPTQFKDGTKVTPVCNWKDGGEYLGTTVNSKKFFILAPDLGFVSVKDNCQNPR